MASLTDQIRQALSKRDGVSEDAMRSLSEAFSSEVDAINQRLTDAVALLRKGLRSEAIQLASLNPNALDAAAALDFPEFDDWCEILLFYEIATPNELQRELVDELSEAIVESQPLEGYLRQHRRMAIARAPLAWRIKTLRRIAELDPGNGIWEEDLESWEKARLQQIEAEVRTAIGGQDFETLQQLHDELGTGNWRVKPPSSITKQIAQALHEHDQQLLSVQLAQHAAALHDAFCQFDEPAARLAASGWAVANESYRGQPTDEWLQQAEPTLDWLRQIDEEAAVAAERSAAVGRLQSRLDTHASLRDLEAAFNACTRFDEPPPEQLLRRYHETVHQHQISATRRNQAIVAAILSMAAITAGVIFYWQSAANHKERVLTAATNLTSLLDAKRLTDAQALWNQLQRDMPKVTSDVTLASLHTRLQSDLTAEQQRAAAFADYLAQAAVDTPDQMVPATLSQAEKIAFSEAEKAAAFKVRRQYNQWDREIAAGQTQSLTTVIRRIEDELDLIEKRDASAVPIARLAQFEQELTQLPAQYPRASNEAVAQTQITRSRTTAIRTAVQELIRRQQADQSAVDRIRQSTSLADLGRNLNQVSRSNLQSELGDDLMATAAEVLLWDVVDDWNRYVVKLGEALAKPITTEAAEELDAQFEVLQAKLKENPAAAPIQRAVDKVARFAERRDILENQFGSLRQTVISDLVTVVSAPDSVGKPGNRYFIYKTYHDQNLSWFGEQSTSRRLNVVVNAGGATEPTKGPLPGPLMVHREPYSTIEMLANLARGSDGTFELDWERSLLRTIGQIRSRPGLDWRIKEMLIQHVLETALQGSSSLKEQASTQLQLLRSRLGERDTWFHPQLLNVNLPDEVESKVIQPLAAIHHRYPTAKDTGAQIANYQYRWLGFFIPTSATETLTPHQVIEATGNGQILVISTTGEIPQQTTFIRVGTVRDGELSIDRNATVRVGIPFFFLSE